jgi:hypothetical protein
MLCYIILCYIMLYYVILCYIMLYYVTLEYKEYNEHKNYKHYKEHDRIRKMVKITDGHEIFDRNSSISIFNSLKVRMFFSSLVWVVTGFFNRYAEGEISSDMHKLQPKQLSVVDDSWCWCWRWCWCCDKISYK